MRTLIVDVFLGIAFNFSFCYQANLCELLKFFSPWDFPNWTRLILETKLGDDPVPGATHLFTRVLHTQKRKHCYLEDNNVDIPKNF